MFKNTIKTTQNNKKPPKTTQNHPKPRKTTQNHANPPKTTSTPVKLTQSHHENTFKNHTKRPLNVCPIRVNREEKQIVEITVSCATWPTSCVSTTNRKQLYERSFVIRLKLYILERFTR